MTYLSFLFHIFPAIPLLMTVQFFFIWGPEEALGGGWNEAAWSPPRARGTPGAGAGPGRYSCELASGPGVSWGPQSQWVGSSFPQCFLPTVDGPWAPSHQVPPKREYCAHLPLLLKHKGRRRHPCRRHPFPQTLLGPLLAPQEAVSFCWHCRGVLLSPAISLSLHFLLDPLSALT